MSPRCLSVLHCPVYTQHSSTQASANTKLRAAFVSSAAFGQERHKLLTLRSKWAMRFECRYWTPSRICLRNCVASSSVRDSFSARKSNNSPPDTSSKIRITSVLFSKMSCRVMMLLCWISRRMLTSRSISSRLTPRRLDDSRRFLINLAAYSTPVLFSLHLRTIANCPL